MVPVDVRRSPTYADGSSAIFVVARQWRKQWSAPPGTARSAEGAHADRQARKAAGLALEAARLPPDCSQDRFVHSVAGFVKRHHPDHIPIRPSRSDAASPKRVALWTALTG
jgi:hypothetical protein